MCRSESSTATGLDVIDVPRSAWMETGATPPLLVTAASMNALASSAFSVACTSQRMALREKMSSITKRSNHTPRAGPLSFVISQLQIWLGPSAVSSGRTRAGWAAWARRSRTWSAARRTRYMVETLAR